MITLVAIETVNEADDEIVDAFAELLRQLSPSALPIDKDYLTQLVRDSGTSLFVARLAEGGAIVGSVTLISYRIPSGFRARLESLVVSSKFRGQGIGARLCTVAINRAQFLGCQFIDLTSQPTRESALKLYSSLGFR
jgi:ribosomal protein S18 acetylase RimI-like enzyme